MKSNGSSAAVNAVDSTRKKSLILSGRELMALKVTPQEWLVDGLLRTGRKRASLIVSPPEAGKSSLAKTLAVALAQGRDFLGRKTVQCDVLYWQTEDSAEDMQESLRRLGYDPYRDAGIFVFNGEVEDSTIATMHQVLADRPTVKLAIIETMNDLLNFEDNKPHEARRAYQTFNSELVAKHPNVAFLGLHHKKKRAVDNSGDGISGSSEIRGRTDAKFYINVRSDDDPRRIFHTQVRNGRNIEQAYLEINKITGEVYLGRTVADERKLGIAKTEENIKQQIIEYFTKHPGKTFRYDCMPFLIGNNPAKQRAYKELRASGILKESGKGTKTSPHTYEVAEISTEELEKAA